MSEKTYLLILTNRYFDGMNKHQKAGQKKPIEKIISFLEEIKDNPIEGKGKPKPLKGYGKFSVWSRKINDKHRLTYEIFEEEMKVKVLSCYGHYDDK